MIKRNRKSLRYKEISGGDDWLTTYSDMMTLLVCFFVLMMGVSEVNVDSYEKIKKEMSTSFGGTYEDPYAKMADKLEEVISVEKLGNEIKLNSKGSGITLIFQGQLLFESGKAQIRPEASLVLQKISDVITSDTEKLFIVVEGHTDNIPINTEQFPSNWELSAGRAARIVREFETFGVNKEKMVAVGMGESKPLKANLNEDGTANYENMSLNRRVVVRLTKDELMKDDSQKINYKDKDFINAVEGALK